MVFFVTSTTLLHFDLSFYLRTFLCFALQITQVYFTCPNCLSRWILQVNSPKKKLLDLGKLKIFSLHKLITHSVVLLIQRAFTQWKEPNNIRRIWYHAAEKARGERVQGCNNRIVFCNLSTIQPNKLGNLKMTALWSHQVGGRSPELISRSMNEASSSFNWRHSSLQHRHGKLPVQQWPQQLQLWRAKQITYPNTIMDRKQKAPTNWQMKQTLKQLDNHGKMETLIQKGKLMPNKIWISPILYLLRQSIHIRAFLI